MQVFPERLTARQANNTLLHGLAMDIAHNVDEETTLQHYCRYEEENNSIFSFGSRWCRVSD